MGDQRGNQPKFKVGDRVTTHFDRRNQHVVREILSVTPDSSYESGMLVTVSGGVACPACGSSEGEEIRRIDAGWLHLVAEAGEGPQGIPQLQAQLEEAQRTIQDLLSELEGWRSIMVGVCLEYGDDDQKLKVPFQTGLRSLDYANRVIAFHPVAEGDSGYMQVGIYLPEEWESIVSSMSQGKAEGEHHEN